MIEIRNLNQKRVCDMTADKRVAVIQQKDCAVIISANPDGTLNITHERIPPAA